MQKGNETYVNDAQQESESKSTGDSPCDSEGDKYKECCKWTQQPGAMLTMYAYAQTHISVLMSILKLQPSFKPEITLRIAELAPKYAGIIRSGYAWMHRARQDNIENSNRYRQRDVVSDKYLGDKYFWCSEKGSNECEEHFGKGLHDRLEWYPKVLPNPDYGYIKEAEYKKIVREEDQALWYSNMQGLLDTAAVAIEALTPDQKTEVKRLWGLN
jgi:hypothetical protein